MNQEEQEINLVDLFLYVCSKFRAIIVVALILMVLAGFYGYYSQNKAEQTDTETKIELAVQDISLTLDEEHLIDLYYSYEDKYEAIKEKNLMNPALTADSADMYCTRLTYSIGNNLSTQAIADLYEAKLEINEDNFGPMYDMTSIATGSSGSFILNVGEEVDPKNLPKLTLSMLIYGIDEEDCKNNTMLAKTKIDALYPEISASLGEYAIELVNDTPVKAEESDIIDYKSNQTSLEYSAYSALAGIKNAMPDNVKTYITTVKDFEKENGSSVVFSTIKFGVIGALAGAFIVACIEAVAYILNKKLRFEDNFEGIFGINILGLSPLNVKKKGLDKCIQNSRRRNIHVFSDEETVEMIAAGIRVRANQNKLTSVYITGSCMGDREKLLMNSVAGKLNGIEVIIGKPMLYFADALEASHKVGAVVLVETVGQSRYDEIFHEIKCCREEDIKILGAVVIE